MNVRRIGISGYMGAGKTTCCGYVSAALRDAGSAVRVVDADAEAKRIMRGDGAMREKLAASFGKTVVGESGIDARALGSLAFGSSASLRLLNGIVHPVLLEKLRGLIFSGEDKGCVICDAALIPLWHIEDWFDGLLWVQSPFDMRYGRLLNKLRLSPDELAGRMRLQEELMPEPHRSPWKIIANQGTAEAMRRCVIAMVEENKI
jgi:dephospho-CoA kinase